MKTLRFRGNCLLRQLGARLATVVKLRFLAGHLAALSVLLSVPSAIAELVSYYDFAAQDATDQIGNLSFNSPLENCEVPSSMALIPCTPAL